MESAKAMPTGSSKRVAPAALNSWIVAMICMWVGLVSSRSMMLTESETWFETQSSRPSGRTATLTGSRPTRMLATSFVLVVVSMTLMPLLVVLAT